MSEEQQENPEIFSVPITQQDFMVIRASLHHTVSFWAHVLETGEFPEGFDGEKGQEILKMSEEVLEKVNLVLTMKPVNSPNVGVTR